MKAYELIKETFLRTAYIPFTHLAWFALYAFWFLRPTPTVVPLGSRLFVLSGLLLPSLLSAGIFGNDIASGRICVLATKPIRMGTLYIFRIIGLILQGALHLAIGSCIMFIGHCITEKGNIDNLGLWALSSWLLFATCAALSTALSVLIKREWNFAIMVLGAILVFAIDVLFLPVAPEAIEGIVSLSLSMDFPRLEGVPAVVEGR